MSSDSGYESAGTPSDSGRKRSYAEAATQGKSRGPTGSRPLPGAGRPPQPTDSRHETTATPPLPSKIAQAVVMHGAPLRYKPATMRTSIEEDNRGGKDDGNSVADKESEAREGSALLGYLHVNRSRDRENEDG